MKPTTPIILITFSLILTPILTSCPRDDTLCARCGGDKCLFCMGSYSLAGRCTDVEVINRVDQCISFRNNNGDCLICNYGYRLTSDHKCVKIQIDDCLAIDRNDENKCILCDKRKLPDQDGLCVNGDDCEIENCALCRNITGEEECIQCSNNFSVLQKSDGSSQCVFQNANTLNCRITEFDNDRDCLECNVSYYYSYGKCVKSEGLDIIQNFSGRDSASIFGIVSAMVFLNNLL